MNKRNILKTLRSVIPPRLHGSPMNNAEKTGPWLNLIADPCFMVK